jgi:hypothetical protein
MEKLPENKPEKPPVLYHASSNNNIENFQPRNNKTRDPNEGPRIFATPSKAMASIFLVETDDSWAQSGECDGVPYLVISDEKRFRDLDNGGTIYTLPSDSFKNDPQKGLGELEWTSSKDVKPIEKETVASALDTMIKNGVKVCFLDSETFQKMQNASDGGESMLKDLLFNNR